MSADQKLRLAETCAHGVPVGPLDEYLAGTQGVLLAVQCLACQAVESDRAAAELAAIVRRAPLPVDDLERFLGPLAQLD